MLVVYSALGSPGASTTAMYLAAQWASTGTEVLLVEADPAGGSLSHNLGVQFTPGLASFVASGLEVRGGNLIDHSQDVLFKNLHVMPATSSPTGARQIVKWLDDRAEDFRAVAEAEMAVIVDGGRVTADSAAAALTTNAAGVVVVARGDSSPTSLEHLGGLLSAEACGDGVERCAVTVGDSSLSAEEWAERCGITFCGSVLEFAEVKGDLAAFLNRNKRKSKKWRVSLEEVAGALLPYAKPAVSGASRARQPVAETPQEPAPEAVAPPRSVAEPIAETAPVDEPPPGAAVAHEPAPTEAGQHHDEEVPAGAGHAAAPQPQAEPYYGSGREEYGWGPPPQPYSPPVPAAHHPLPPGQYPPDQQPVYFEPPPAPPEPAYHDAPYPVYEPPPPQHAYQPQGYPPQPAAPQHPPPPQVPQPPPQVPQPPAPEPPPPPPVAQPPPPPAPQPPPHGYQEAPHGQAPAYPQPPAPPPQPPEPQQWPYEHAVPPLHQVQQPPPPIPQPPHAAGHGAPPEAPAERREIAPSGSFRDWAARLHGQAPEGTSNQGHGGVS